MTRVAWNEAGQRFYEAGTDRGVLYLDGQDGVPWNGLIGVSQKTSGGAPKAYYLDGYKYLNIAANEEFSATIDAYSSPREFDACDGTGYIHNGLSATQQLRKTFGFTYRTLIGNDADGTDHGYKIHLVYNALAAPAERSYSTLSDSVSPMKLSWGVSTIAPVITGIKPTAHFVIDSRLTPPRLLAAIEDILYGNSNFEARLPTAAELNTLFTELPPIAFTNIMTNSSFELSSGQIQVRHNYNTNPKVINSITGWATTAAAATLVATANGGQVDVTSGPTGVPLFFNVVNIASASTDRWSASMEVTVPVGFPAAAVRLDIYSYGSNLVVATSGAVTVYPGTTVTIVSNSNGVLPGASTTGVRGILYGNSTVQGARMFVKNAMLEKQSIVGRYFDGSQRPKYRRNASNHPQAKSVTGWQSNSGTVYARTYDAAGGFRPGAGAALFTRQNNSHNTVLASVYGVGAGTYDANGWTPVSPGEVWTVSAAAKADIPFRSQMSVRFFDSAGVAMGTGSTNGEMSQDMSANAVIRPSQTITVPLGATHMTVGQLVFTLGQLTVGGERVWMSDALIEKTAVVGEFFDATTTPPTGYVNVWEGVATSSPSYMYDDDFTIGWAGTINDSDSILYGLGVATYSSPSTVVKGIQSKHWSKQGLYSLRQIPAYHTQGSAYTEIANHASPRGFIPGETYTLLISYYQEVLQGIPTVGNSFRAVAITATTNPADSSYVQAEDRVGEQLIKFVFKIPLTGTWYLRLYNGGMYGEPSTFWDLATAILGVYNGPQFNGDTEDTDIQYYEWVGMVNLSESTIRSWY